MRRAADALLDDIDEIAELLVNEQGKPRAEAYTMELLPTVDALHWCAKAGPKILADEKVRMSPGLPGEQERPLHLRADRRRRRDRALELPLVDPLRRGGDRADGRQRRRPQAGSLTPLLGEAIRRVFEKGGLPEGLIRVVHGGGAVGDALARSSVGKVFFTGSVDVGRKVGEVCAAAQGLGARAGRQGPDDRLRRRRPRQRDLRRGLGRLRQRRPDLLGDRARLRDARGRRPLRRGRRPRAQKLRLGNPLEWETEIGPMTSEGQYEIVVDLIEDAVASGATKLCGGPTEVAGLSGKYVAPTVLTGVTHEMRIMREEIFGPVLPIVVVDSEQEAIDLANDSEFGLGASVWTKDRQKGERHRAADRVGHGLGQRPLLQPRRLPVRLGRRQGLRRRPLALQIRLLRVREHQDERLGAGPDPRLLVAPLRPAPWRSGSASAKLLYGKGRHAPSSARRAPARC
jgi:hypothetical protein